MTVSVREPSSAETTSAVRDLPDADALPLAPMSLELLPLVWLLLEPLVEPEPCAYSGPLVEVPTWP